MASPVRPGLAGKFCLLLETSALIKKCAEGMFHDLPVDMLANRELCRTNILLDIHDRILAGRLNFGKIEPPSLVTRRRICIPAIPNCRRSRLDHLAGRKLDQSVGLAGRISDGTVIANLRSAYDGNLP